METAKTASSAIRYFPERISSIIDSRFAGSSAEREFRQKAEYRILEVRMGFIIRSIVFHLNRL